MLGLSFHMWRMFGFCYRNGMHFLCGWEAVEQRRVVWSHLPYRRGGIGIDKFVYLLFWVHLELRYM